MNRPFDRWLNGSTLLLICGAIALAGLSTASAGKPKNAQDETASSERSTPRGPHSTQGFAPVVKKVLPSVVKVNTTTKGRQVDLRSSPDMAEGPFRWFFGPQFGGRMPMERWEAPPQRGLGSGVIVSKDGYILTNNHVVENADEVKVTLHDGKEMTAKVVGRDPHTDVAVIKVDERNLPALEFANSDDLEVGDVVLAIGNPFGIGQTVTSGIVSGKGRGNIGLDYEDFIQTDAAINPGNSGGALVDADGRLVGLNTAILSRTGGNQGIGFAIPVNLAQHVMDNLIKDGRVTRGYIGAMIQDVTPALAKEFRVKEQQGVLVGEVKAGGPAAKAGLEAGDIITELNGRKVEDSRTLRLRVAETAPGTSVAMKVLREGETKTIRVTIKELPGQELLAKNEKSAASDDGVLNGVTVADVDSQARRQTDLPRNIKGALITEVSPSSPAAEAGLRPGDVITEINRQPVRSADEAVKLTETAKDKTTLLRVWSNGGSRYVVVDESKNG